MGILGRIHKLKTKNIIFNDNVALIDPLQDPQWDKFVENHPHGWLTHLSGWKLVLENSFKHLRGHYLVLMNDDNDGYKAALPLYEANSWLTGRKMVSIPFATLSDPLVTDKTELTTLLKACVMLQGQLRCDSLEIRSFNTLPMFDDELLSPQSLYKHHYIELDAEPDQLKNRFHRSCVRQRINRAVQSKLNLVKGTNEESLRDFYKLYMLSRKRLSLPPQPYAFIKSMWETFSPSGKISLLMAEMNGQIIAGMILFKYKERVSAEYAVMDDSFYNVSPNHFLFWEAIKSASGEGYKLFDFGRTDPGNTNLMEFKSRWGTKVADIRHFEYPGIRNKSENKERTFAYNLVKNICSRSPDAVFQLIGKLCYRHMY